MTTEVFYQADDLDVLAAVMPRYYDWIFEHFTDFLAGVTVEYGAGIGTCSRLMRPYVDRLDLVEPSPNLAARLAQSFSGDAAVLVLPLTFEQHIRDLPDASVDTIVLISVLEHVRDDGEAISQFRRVLRPGGRLLLFVPALAMLMSKLDRCHGHFRRYHRRPLVRSLEDAGFTIERDRYMDLPGALAWWLFNTLGGSTAFNRRMVSFYDRFLVPPARALERWLTPPFGKNLVVVARTPLSADSS